MAGDEEGSIPDEEESVPEPLMKKWTAENGQVYYGKIRVGSETYTCGDCVAMETDEGK